MAHRTQHRIAIARYADLTDSHSCPVEVTTGAMITDAKHSDNHTQRARYTAGGSGRGFRNRDITFHNREIAIDIRTHSRAVRKWANRLSSFPASRTAIGIAAMPADARTFPQFSPKASMAAMMNATRTMTSMGAHTWYVHHALGIAPPDVVKMACTAEIVIHPDKKGHTRTHPVYHTVVTAQTHAAQKDALSAQYHRVFMSLGYPRSMFGWNRPGVMDL